MQEHDSDVTHSCCTFAVHSTDTSFHWFQTDVYLSVYILLGTHTDTISLPENIKLVKINVAKIRRPRF